MTDTINKLKDRAVFRLKAFGQVPNRLYVELATTKPEFRTNTEKYSGMLESDLLELPVNGFARERNCKIRNQQRIKQIINNMTRFETLEKLAFEALNGKNFGDAEREAANVLLNQELEIVKHTGCAEMFLVAEEMCRKVREDYSHLDPSPADGSSLSMLCYLLGSDA